MFRFEDKVDARHGIMSLYLSEREAEKAQRSVFLIFFIYSEVKMCCYLNLLESFSYIVSV